MELNNKSDVWDFVQEYYPNYTGSDEIAYNDDLLKLVENEVNGVAEKVLHRNYDGDINNPQIRIDYDSSKAYILEKSIESYLESL